MTTYVIDTSALVKAVIPEEGSDEARYLISLHRNYDARLVAPDFLILECANVLWKTARRGRATVEDVVGQLDRLREVNIRLVPQADLLEDALRLALDMNVTVYDSLYCALARRENAELITEDRRLRNALDLTDIRSLTLRMWAE